MQNSEFPPDKSALFRRAFAILAAAAIVLPNLKATDTLFVGSYNSPAVIGKYTSDGSTVSSSLFTVSATGSFATGIAISGTSVFVSDATNFTVGKYTTDGATVDAAFLSQTGGDPISGPYDVAIANSILYVANAYTGKVNTFNPTTGDAINPALITMNYAAYLAVTDTAIYVGSYSSNTINKYNLNGTDAVATQPLVTATSLGGLAVSGTKLFVLDGGNIKEYTTGGALVNAAFITGLSGPQRLAAANGYLYVTDASGVHKYSVATGAETGSPLITLATIPHAVGVLASPTPTPSPTPKPAIPTVQVKGSKKITTTKSSYTIEGTASASATAVKVKIGNGAFTPAKGTPKAWTFKAKLAMGKNTLTVQAFNSDGEASKAVKVLITRK